jgi:bile acid-coenzyme A ligase
MPLVPTMMHRIIRLGPDVLAKYDVSSLNTILHFGAACPAFVKQAWIEWLGPERVHEIYGGTEGQGYTWITGTEWLEHPGSVGRPFFGRFKVFNEHGHEVPPGTTGEIYMLPDTGPGSTYRYIGANPREHDGWESLGDLGHLDADGWLYLADRRVNLILSGGANVYPAEVEAVLDQHPAVLSSVAIGVPDDDMGEVIHAFVQASGVTVETLQTWVDEPLADDAGKVRRARLRDDYLARRTP